MRLPRALMHFAYLCNINSEESSRFTLFSMQFALFTTMGRGAFAVDGTSKYQYLVSNYA